MATHFFGDTAVLTGRTLRHVTRSLDTIITTAIMPIAMMLMFVYVFGGAIDTGPVEYVDYLLPGILLITIASGISYTAFRLFMDMKSGIFERFQSMPIVSRLAAHAGVTVRAVRHYHQARSRRAPGAPAERHWLPRPAPRSRRPGAVHRPGAGRLDHGRRRGAAPD